MNLDELNDALSASDPDPVSVYVQLDRKRRRSRQRMLAATSGMAVVVVAVVITGAVMRGIIKGIPSAGSSSSSAAAAAAPNAGGAVSSADSSSGRGPAAAAPQTSAVPGPAKNTYAQAGGQGSAGSCAAVSLQDSISKAVHQGASVIVATGALTGKSVTGNPATAGSPAFYAMTLSSVQTLRGPVVATGSTAWIPGPAAGTSASVTSALLAPGGRLFAIVEPQAVTHDLVGPTLRLAPIVGQDVVFSPSGCWDVTALQPSPYQGSTSFKAVPDETFGGHAHPAAQNGLYAVPLAKVEQVAEQA